SFRESFAEVLATHSNTIYIAYDGDEAGRTGAKRAGLFLHQAGMTVHIVNMPNGKDVNDVLLVEGREGLLEIIRSNSREFKPPKKLVNKSREQDPERILTYLDAIWENLDEETRMDSVKKMHRIL